MEFKDKIKTAQLQRLDTLISREWQEIFSSEMAPKVYKTIEDKDIRFYAIYMTQVYHYAYHTPRSLALAGANLANGDIKLMEHFFEHALEENGHDMIAFNDLKAMGVPLKKRRDMPPALPSTETMIAYVKYLSLSPEPYRSLGYHYWIEQPYGYIDRFMQQLNEGLQLQESQFSFYKTHKSLDEKHGDDVQSLISYCCQTEQQWEAIYEVAQTTMRQFAQMIFESLEEYEKLKNGSPSQFQIINAIKVP